MSNLNFSDLFEGTRKEKIDNIIKYTQQNIASVSVMLTAFISIGSIVIKIIHYLTEFGYVSYFNIPTSSININSDNLIYEFFTSGIFALLLFLLNLIPFYIWKSDKGIVKKIILSIFLPALIAIPGTGFIIITNFEDLFRTWTWDVVFGVAILWSLIGLLIFSFGIAVGVLTCLFEKTSRKDSVAIIKDATSKKAKRKIQNKKNKMRKQVFSTKFQIVIFMIIFLVVESLVCMLTGYIRANNKNEFEIVENLNNKTYAIIYETQDTYFLYECEIEDDKIKSINLNTKLHVKKESINFIRRILTKS